MVFEIPEPYVWDESFKVFYESLDEQHKGLFQGIFSVAKTPADEHALQHLVKVVDDHFHFEEEMMQKAKYTDFDTHKKIHVDFQSALKGLHCPVAADKITWAKEWLVNHIKGTDFNYKGKL